MSATLNRWESCTHAPGPRRAKAVARTRREQVLYYAELRSQIADTWLPRYRAAVERELAREAKEVAEAVAQDAPFEDLTAVWTERMIEAQRPLAIQMAVEGYQLAEAEFGKSAGLRGLMAKSAAIVLVSKQETIAAFDRAELLANTLTPDVDLWLRTVTKKMSQTTLDLTIREVEVARAAGLTGAQLSRTLRTALVTRSKVRADLIARSATIWNFNQGAKQLYKDEGVAVMEWIVTVDDVLCEFCEPFDGRQIEISESFVPGGERVPGNEGGSLTPALAVEHPPLHPNCRCAIVPVV